jgi:large subunit ribosomal protein L18
MEYCGRVNIIQPSKRGQRGKMFLEKRKMRQRRKIKMKNYQCLPRLMIFRSARHIYGQIVNIKGEILTSLGSHQKSIRWEGNSKSYNVEGASIVGQKLGEMAKELGIQKVVFDRSGYKFHGRVKSFADSVRKSVEI